MRSSIAAHNVITYANWSNISYNYLFVKQFLAGGYLSIHLCKTSYANTRLGIVSIEISALSKIGAGRGNSLAFCQYISYILGNWT